MSVTKQRLMPEKIRSINIFKFVFCKNLRKIGDVMVHVLFVYKRDIKSVNSLETCLASKSVTKKTPIIMMFPPNVLPPVMVCPPE